MKKTHKLLISIDNETYKMLETLRTEEAINASQLFTNTVKKQFKKTIEKMEKLEQLSNELEILKEELELAFRQGEEIDNASYEKVEALREEIENLK